MEDNLHLEIANRVSYQKLQEQVALMRRLSTAEGFYIYWFECLPDKVKHPTNKACFDFVNETYNELFGQYKYSDYNSFSNYVTRRNKQLKQNNGK